MRKEQLTKHFLSELKKKKKRNLHPNCTNKYLESQNEFLSFTSFFFFCVEL